MKMEIPWRRRARGGQGDPVAEGQTVQEGDTVAVLE